MSIAPNRKQRIYFSKEKKSKYKYQNKKSLHKNKNSKRAKQ